MALYILLYLGLLGDIRSAARPTGTLITDTESPDIGAISDATTFSNNFSYRNSHSSPSISDTLIDNESSDTDALTPDAITLNNDSYVSTDYSTANMSGNEEMIDFKDRLDELLDQMTKACHSYLETENGTILEITKNLTISYMETSSMFLRECQIKNQYQNNTTTDEHECDRKWEYEAKLEIVEIFSNELVKMIRNVTENTGQRISYEAEQNVPKEAVYVFEELQKVVTLNTEVKDLYKLKLEKHTIYWKNKRSEDFDDLMDTTKKIIETENEILKIIDDSKNAKHQLELEKYRSKSNIRYLLNGSMWEENRRLFEGYLSGLYKENGRYVGKYEQNNNPSYVIIPIAYGVIFVVGIIGNGLLMLVFLNHKGMRTKPNVMIINLTVVDTLGLFINVLLNVLTQTSTLPLGSGLCKLYKFGSRLVIGASIYSVVVISVQRFVAITEFFTFEESRCRFFRKFQPLLNVLFVWVFTSVIPIAYVMNAKVNSQRCRQTEAVDMQFKKTIIYVDFLVNLVLPLVVIAVTSGLTSWHLKHTAKNMPGEAMGQENVKHARVLSSKILQALIVVFAVCYMPMFIFMIYLNGDPENSWNIYYSHVTLYCLMYCIACFNPIVLYISSTNYRKYMNLYLCCKRQTTAN